MSDVHTSVSYKRRYLEQQCTENPFQPLKRLKIKRSSYFTTDYWNNLSRLWLTKNALKELDRRNNQTPSHAQSPSVYFPHRRVTRDIALQWKKHESNWQLTRSAPEFVSSLSKECLQYIKAFAKHGGPDLSNLRGVCVF
jgi:hypothetical protein